MSRTRDIAISFSLAIAIVTIFTGVSIPIVSATQYWMDNDDTEEWVGVMLVQAYVGCYYDEDGFITETCVHSGFTYVPWPHSLLDWWQKGDEGTNLCWTKQYGKAWQWPGGPTDSLTAYTEITV